MCSRGAAQTVSAASKYRNKNEKGNVAATDLYELKLGENKFLLHPSRTGRSVNLWNSTQPPNIPF